MDKKPGQSYFEICHLKMREIQASIGYLWAVESRRPAQLKLYAN
jgi:hypothetical protein